MELNANYMKNFIKKLKSLTNEDDTVIYSFINNEKIPVEESVFWDFCYLNLEQQLTI